MTQAHINEALTLKELSASAKLLIRFE